MIAITYLIAGKLPTPSPFVTHTSEEPTAAPFMQILVTTPDSL